MVRVVASRPPVAASGLDEESDRKRRRRSGDPRKRDPRSGPDARKKAQARFGKTTPRLFTPPLVSGEPGPCGCGCAHTDATTLGFEAVRFAEETVQIRLRPWQRWLLIHALELLDDGSFRFRKLVVLVARQNGKSILSVILSLFFMYVLEARTVLSAAQDLDTAEEIWQDGVDLVTAVDDDTDEPVRPELAAFYHDTILVNGKKALVLTTGERWKVKAANRRAGRGLRGDLIILDELREHHTWHAWSAITKTTNARPNAQVWTFSNAGDVASVVLRHLRIQAHRQLGDPDGVCAAEEAAAPTEYDVEQVVQDNPELAGLTLEEVVEQGAELFLAEWSAEPGLSKWDRDGWAQANPSLGYGDVTIRVIAGDCETDPEWEFRTEVLCQWPVGALDGIFDPGKWQETQNQPVDGELAASDRIVGDVVAAFDTSRDGRRTYIAWAGRRPDGLAQGTMVAAQPGTDWVKPWLLKHAGKIESVSAQERGAPASDLLATLAKDVEFTIPVVPIGGSDLTATHGRCRGLVRDGKVRHNPQPPLDQAADHAVTKPLADNEVIDRRRSPVEVAPLIAWEFAVYQLTQPAKPHEPPPPPPQVLTEDNLTIAKAIRSSDFDAATVGF